MRGSVGCAVVALLFSGASFCEEAPAEKAPPEEKPETVAEKEPGRDDAGAAREKKAAASALSAKQLKDRLERWGIKDYLYDDQRQLFFFGLREEDEEYLFHVRLFGEGRRQFLLAAARYVLQVKPDEGKGEVFFRKIATLNYGLVLGRVGWDQETGEVSCDYVLPVSDGLCQDGFSDLMTGLLSAARQVRSQLGSSPPSVSPKEEQEAEKEDEGHREEQGKAGREVVGEEQAEQTREEAEKEEGGGEAPTD